MTWVVDWTGSQVGVVVVEGVVVVGVVIGVGCDVDGAGVGNGFDGVGVGAGVGNGVGEGVGKGVAGHDMEVFIGLESNITFVPLQFGSHIRHRKVRGASWRR